MKPTKKSDNDSLLQYPNEIMKIPVLRRSKYYINIGSFWNHINCDSTRPWMAASKENKLSPSFSGFKSQTFIHGVSGTDNDEGLDGVSWQLTNGQYLTDYWHLPCLALFIYLFIYFCLLFSTKLFFKALNSIVLHSLRQTMWSNVRF